MAQAENRERRLPISTILGLNVYRFRVLRVPKLTQKTLAAQSGISLTTIQGIEAARDPVKDQFFPQLNTLEALAVALGVEVRDLVDHDQATRVWLKAAA